MKIRAIIVDDEQLARCGLHTRLSRHADVEIVAECRNGREAIEAVRNKWPDLVLLDVEMPGKDGFDVLQALGPKLPYTIFVTAHDKHALRAFEVHALDYLLKPIDDERLDVAMQRARQALQKDRGHEMNERLAGWLQTMTAPRAPSPGRVVVKSAGRVAFVNIADIDWVEAAGDYVSIHAGTKEWLHRETMTEFEKRVGPHGFARIHRSVIVNADRITELRSLDNGEYRVFLRTGTELRLSRNHRAVLDKLMPAEDKRPG